MWGKWAQIGLGVAMLHLVGTGCSLVSLDELSSGAGGGGAGGVGAGGEPLTCDSDQKICDGACVAIADPQTGCKPDTCDPCFANSASACVSGDCQFEMCAEGFEDCDDDLTNGCEADLQNDPATCGSCEIACEVANASPGCALGACTLGDCLAPYADCDGVLDNGCESNATTDEHNCGVCEHDCLGGACGAAQCEPFELVDEIGLVGGLATDGVNVYWTDSIGQTGAVHRLEIYDEGLPPPVESVATNQDFPNDLILAGSTLYWINSGPAEIRKTDAGNSAVPGSVVASVPTCAGRLAANATYLFWTESGFNCSPNRVRRVPLATASLPQLVSDNLALPWGIAAGPTRAYWSELVGGTVSAGASPASTTVLASGLSMPGYVAVSADEQLFFAQNFSSSGSISRIDLADSTFTPTPLVSFDEPDAIFVSDIIADDAYVYWSDGNRLRRVAVGGGRLEDLWVEGAGRLTQDAVSVYWHDGPSILRIAKPPAPTRR